jgi:hypothetical protein
MSAYALTKKGAEAALEALDEMWGPCDIQLAFRAIKSVDPRRTKYVFDRIRNEMCGMAPRKSIVGLSEDCLVTTLNYGEKLWLEPAVSSAPYPR